MAETFTPGPWEVSSVSTHERCSVWVAGDCVADVYGGYGLPFRANAALIAAAPDLYEALTDLLQLFDEVAPGYAESTIAFSARAALAKVSPQALSTLSTEAGEKANG